MTTGNYSHYRKKFGNLEETECGLKINGPNMIKVASFRSLVTCPKCMGEIKNRFKTKIHGLTEAEQGTPT